MEKIILTNHLAPGDVCALTAGIKALQEENPGKFQLDYRGTASELFNHNPYLTPLDDEDPEVRHLKTFYPSINTSNQRPRHFIEGYAGFFEEVLGVSATVKEFRPDIYLDDAEMGWQSQVNEITKLDHPFWIIVAGGKYDYTIKWWDDARLQEVVNHFAGKICFVRVGQDHHHHPPISGVIDLKGKTNTRQLVRLVHHSQGVLCPVTFLMHLAAGVPCRFDRPPRRPCVVFAGGREPAQWEAYPNHQFIHTLGQLPCCMHGGCWKSRTEPLKGERIHPELNGSLCLRPVHREGHRTLPKCMDMITADEVCRRIQGYFDGGAFRFLTDDENKAVQPHLT